MKRSLLFTLCLLILLAAPIHAQEPTPTAPWPPDPALIFADGVTWEEVQPASPAAQPAPDVVNDFEQRVIRVRDEATDTWREFPYPPGVEYVNWASLHADGLVWLLLLSQFNYTSDPRPDDVLLLDPATGEYSPPPTVCDGRVIQADPGEGEWVAAYAPGTSDHATLCHSETGEQRDVLPADGMDWRVSESPDGGWIILAGWIQNEEGYAYAYPSAGGDLTVLGVVPSFTSEYIGFCGWVSEEKGVLCTSSRMMPSSAATNYYAFDVTQPDSLEFLFFGWDNIFFDWDNAQLVSFQSDDYFTYWSGSVGAGRPCTLSIYDVVGLHQFELDYECLKLSEDMVVGVDFSPQQYRLFYRQDHMLYFLTTHSEEATIAELHSYDLDLDPSAPGQMEVLSIGEIETIRGLSPDQRYIVLITDTNHALDLYPYPIDRRLGWQVTIVDRTQEFWDITYQSEPLFPSRPIWLDNQTLVIISEEVTSTHRMGEHDLDGATVTQPATIRRITLNDDGSYDMLLMTDPGPGYRDSSGVSPDNQYWMYGGNLINLRTFERAVFLRDDRPAGYTIASEWNDDGTLQVTLRQGYESITYHVDLPAHWTSLQEN